MTDPSADHSVAAALQRVLLPGGLPDLAGWAVATLYEPAGESVLVGGDFYDWVVLPDGRLLFFLGDVSGKGPLAGALGMSVRKALKGIAWVTGEPLEALPLLEQALADEFRESFATLCLLELTPDSGQVRLLLAGHPPPWLRGGGVFAEVEAPPNSLLGPRLRAEWQHVTLDLRPGDSLFVFTDGFSDARLVDGGRLGDARLGAFLASLPDSLSSYETVLQTDAHLRRVAERLDDDVIIGVLTYQPTPVAVNNVPAAELRGVRLSPHSTSAGVARQFVVDTCRKWGLHADRVAAAELVASELVTNAVLHARTDLELRIGHEEHELRIEVRDGSRALPQLPGRGPEKLLVEFGRGLSMLAALGATLGAEASSEGKVVWAVLPG